MQIAFLSLVFIYYVLWPLKDYGFRLADPDTGWHIFTGRYIREHMALPYSDPFSYTSDGFPWYNISWLWDIFVSLIDGVYGLAGMVLLCTLVSGFLAVYLCHICMKRGTGFLAMAIALGVFAVNYFLYMTARPHLISYFLILLYYDVLRQYIDGRYSKKALLWLLPVFIFWVNVHGYFIIGMMLIAVYGIEALARKQREKFYTLFIFGVTCLLLTLVNPYGYHIIEGFAWTVNGQMKPHILEWKPIFLYSQYIVLAFAALTILPTLRYQKLADIILVFFWAVQAYNATRMLMVFALFAFIPSVYGLQIMLHRYKRLARADAYIRVGLSHDIAKSISASLACLACIFVLMSPRFIDYSVTKTYCPVNEINFLDLNYPNARVLSIYDYGGFITYLTNAKIKTFIDGKADTAFPPELVRDYLRIKNMEPGWFLVMERYNVDVFMFPLFSDQVNELMAMGTWRIVYTDGKAAIMVRNEMR